MEPILPQDLQSDAVAVHRNRAKSLASVFSKVVSVVTASVAFGRGAKGEEARGRPAGHQHPLLTEDQVLHLSHGEAHLVRLGWVSWNPSCFGDTLCCRGSYGLRESLSFCLYRQLGATGAECRTTPTSGSWPGLAGARGGWAVDAAEAPRTRGGPADPNRTPPAGGWLTRPGKA